MRKHDVCAIAAAVALVPASARADEGPPPADLPTITPSLLMQAWAYAEHTDTTVDAFRIRRAEVHLKGAIIPDRVKYEVHADFAKVLEPKSTTIDTTPAPVTIKEPQSKLAVLQDLYLTYVSRHAEVSIGQFKIPVSWEGYNSSGKLLFPERATVSKQFGDARDLGIRVTKTYDRFMYSAGVFNGAGANTPESNRGKDVALRVEVYPIDGLTLAAVTYDSVFDRKQPGAKDRWELDVRYEHEGILAQAEAIAARDYDASSNRLDGKGFYAAVAYRLPSDVQPALRVGAFDPNDDVMTDDQATIELGVNYYLRDHQAKVQAVYGHTEFRSDKHADDLLLVAAQLAY